MSNNNIPSLWDSWQVGEILGKGTFGTVYKLSKTEFGKTYYAALKHISIPANDQEKEQLYIDGIANEKTIKSYYDKVMYSLQDEIKTCYTLKGNTHIVSYEDHKIIPKKDGIGYDIFIKMELLDSLSSKIKSATLPTEEVVKVGIDICKALETLEEAKIIHRDIKPSNLFVNEKGKYKLGDFGVARELNNAMSGLSIKGTLKYMPPEIFRGEKVDFTSDIYSLGLVMHSMLNDNRPPFTPPAPTPITYEEAEMANARRMKGEKLPKPLHADDLLSEVILNACEYLPQRRWKSATAFRKALEIYLEKRKSNAIPIVENKSTVNVTNQTTQQNYVDMSLSRSRSINNIIQNSTPINTQSDVQKETKSKKVNIALIVVLTVLVAVLIGITAGFIVNI